MITLCCDAFCSLTLSVAALATANVEEVHLSVMIQSFRDYSRAQYATPDLVFKVSDLSEMLGNLGNLFSREADKDCLQAEGG